MPESFEYRLNLVRSLLTKLIEDAPNQELAQRLNLREHSSFLMERLEKACQTPPREPARESPISRELDFLFKAPLVGFPTEPKVTRVKPFLNRKRQILPFGTKEHRLLQKEEEENAISEQLPQHRLSYIPFNERYQTVLDETREIFAHVRTVTVEVENIEYCLNDGGMVTTYLQTRAQDLRNVSGPLGLLVDPGYLTQQVIRPGTVVEIGSPSKRLPTILRVLSGVPQWEDVETSRPSQLCPVCHHNTLETVGLRRRCINGRCLGIIDSTLKRICSRHGFKLPYSHTQLRRLNLRDASDLFRLYEISHVSSEDTFLSSTERTETAKVLQQTKEQITLPSLIYCLNLPGISPVSAQCLSKVVGTLDKLPDIKAGDLYRCTKGHGPIVEAALRRKAVNQMIAAWLNVGVNPHS